MGYYDLLQEITLYYKRKHGITRESIVLQEKFVRGRKWWVGTKQQA